MQLLICKLITFGMEVTEGILQLTADEIYQIFKQAVAY